MALCISGLEIISGESPDIVTSQIYLGWSHIVSGQSNLKHKLLLEQGPMHQNWHYIFLKIVVA